ncbi:FBD-like protein [Artemisia annua]|uniref:FBD-like protein n=1 Tax=Artemisia annua TaxID=35608 RepID=A0A2U1LM39_ARTAN|nr:FBD-like protein [Artemisia annua]
MVPTTCRRDQFCLTSKSLTEKACGFHIVVGTVNSDRAMSTSWCGQLVVVTRSCLRHVVGTVINNSELFRDSKSYEMSSHGDNLDRLSSLPEELISHILSLMPTRLAVRTCILSKRLRYSWTLVHNLDLDFDHFWHSNRFSKFVDKVLELFKPFQIKKIRMHVFSLNIPTSVVSKWISKAVTFNVCELDIKVTDVELPLSLFTCKTLTKFRLDYSYPHCSLPDCVSSINLLPNLITLDINVASTLFYDAVKLIHGCPILVNLSLTIKWWDDKEDYTFNIPTLKRLKLSIFRSSRRVNKVILNVPNLECLIVDGDWCSLFVIEDLSSLVEANVSCRVSHENLWFELLKVISEAKFLSLTTSCWMSLNDQCQWPKFPNLKRLELQGCAKTVRRWHLIAQFLERCFMLEYFHVEKPNAGRWVDPQAIPTCMPMKLKTMRYSQTKGNMNDIQFLKFILSNSKALKTLTVECDATLSSEEEKQLLAELSTLYRASRDFLIHFVGSSRRYKPRNFCIVILNPRVLYALTFNNDLWRQDGVTRKKTASLISSLNIPTSVVSKWISKAVTFNVCELDIKVTDVELPLSLFTCKTLTKFRLDYSYPHCSLPDCVSSINLLPNLITLDINVASTLFYDAVKLIHGCPILVNLSLTIKWWDDKEDYTFNIPTLKRLKLSIFRSSRRVNKVILNVPNLECLIVDGDWCSLFVIEDLSSLVEANVSCRVSHENLWFELLKVISEAKFLSLTTSCWMSLNDQCQWPKFPNLKRLELQGCAKTVRRWHLIAQFLERCFMLEYFHVEKPNAGRWVDPQAIPTCMPMKLKTMRYSQTKGNMNDIQFLKFILSNSKALKTLTVECDATLSSEEEKQLLAELSTLYRASRDYVGLRRAYSDMQGSWL